MLDETSKVYTYFRRGLKMISSISNEQEKIEAIKNFDEDTLIEYLSIDNRALHLIRPDRITDKVAKMFIESSDGYGFNSLVEKAKDENAGFKLTDEIYRLAIEKRPLNIIYIENPSDELLFYTFKMNKKASTGKENYSETEAMKYIISRLNIKQFSDEIIKYIIKEYYRNENIIVSLFQKVSINQLENLPDEYKLLLEVTEDDGYHPL